MSSNDYYRGLNRRFDKRVGTLIRMGWLYDKEANAFRSRRKAPWKTRVISGKPAWCNTWSESELRQITIGAEVIMRASRGMWLELLAMAYRVPK